MVFQGLTKSLTICLQLGFTLPVQHLKYEHNKDYIDKEDVIPNYMIGINKAALTLKLTKAEECTKEV